MDNKEVNDPLTSVTLIKGKSTLTDFYFITMECRYTSERQVALFFCDAPDRISVCLTKKRRERKEKKNHESHLGASVAIRGRLLAGEFKVPEITLI